MLRISVSDNGPGINAKFLPYVFDRFRQADATSTRSHGGLGIGLTIVRHIVELHGGRVQADSAGEGRGATFIVELPVVPIKPELPTSPLAPAPASLSSTPGFQRRASISNGVRILVVDDEADAREVIAKLLRRAGAAVDHRRRRSAASSQETFSRDQCADMLISDIAMPECDGYELLRNARQLPGSARDLSSRDRPDRLRREEDRAARWRRDSTITFPSRLKADYLPRLIRDPFRQKIKTRRTRKWQQNGTAISKLMSRKRQVVMSRRIFM